MEKVLRKERKELSKKPSVASSDTKTTKGAPKLNPANLEAQVKTLEHRLEKTKSKRNESLSNNR